MISQEVDSQDGILVEFLQLGGSDDVEVLMLTVVRVLDEHYDEKWMDDGQFVLELEDDNGCPWELEYNGWDVLQEGVWVSHSLAEETHGYHDDYGALHDDEDSLHGNQSCDQLEEDQ